MSRYASKSLPGDLIKSEIKLSFDSNETATAIATEIETSSSAGTSSHFHGRLNSLGQTDHVGSVSGYAGSTPDKELGPRNVIP